MIMSSFLRFAFNFPRHVLDKTFHRGTVTVNPAIEHSLLPLLWTLLALIGRNVLCETLKLHIVICYARTFKIFQIHTSSSKVQQLKQVGYARLSYQLVWSFHFCHSLTLNTGLTQVFKHGDGSKSDGHGTVRWDIEKRPAQRKYYSIRLQRKCFLLLSWSRQWSVLCTD